jgi:hypothetical protein
MYFLDPKRGRQRRAQVREKMIRLSHDIQDARNRLRGLAAGDLSVLIGGGLFLSGLQGSAPTA